jgi:sporulation protein YlmC with PRC-barrel domain
MQIRYYEMIGRPVRAANGAHLGRVADLVAERRGDALCVTALLIGPASLVQRISFKRLPIFRVAPPSMIPWTEVARIGDAIHLHPAAVGPRPITTERAA